MKIVKSLLKFLSKNVQLENNVQSTNDCPNCWGREEYGGRLYKRVNEENLNIKNTESNIGWINAYANRNLLGNVMKSESKWQPN